MPKNMDFKRDYEICSGKSLNERTTKTPGPQPFLIQSTSWQNPKFYTYTEKGDLRSVKRSGENWR